MARLDINIRFEEIDYDKKNSYIKNNEIVFTPIVHAEWVEYDYKKTNSRLDMEFPYECSNCNHRQGLLRYKYCPVCGAKMDK